MGLLSRWFGGESVNPTPVRTSAEFDEVVLGSELPVIVDVWSPTCAPCRKLVPVLVEVATRHADRVRVVEIDVAHSDPRLVMRLGVQATPTIIVFDGGEEFGRTAGFRPRGWFDEMIAKEFSAP
jgi:thioredoxin-like negative regulator of GroEL